MPILQNSHQRIATGSSIPPIPTSLSFMSFAISASTAAKFGCGLGQCGACSVLIDGRSERSCVMTIAAARRANAITTLEGLGSAAKPSAIQTAFINEHVPQCGYCTSGMIVSATALLASNPKPTEAQINAALDGNLCRCGSHVRVVRAVMAASGQAG